jgi:hypothetical protein
MERDGGPRPIVRRIVMTKYADESRKGAVLLAAIDEADHCCTCSVDRLASVTNTIHLCDRQLKKKQPPLPLERNTPQGQGGANDVKATSAEERVNVGQKREVLHAATSPFFQSTASGD